MGLMILTVLHYTLCFGLILIVLLQAGKGGGLASAFGGGSSETIFGARRGNILTKVTAVGVSLFMITSLLLVIILPRQVSMVQKKGTISEDKMRDVKRPQIPGLPVGGPSPAQTTPGATPAPPPSPEIPAPAQGVPKAPPAAPASPPTPQVHRLPVGGPSPAQITPGATPAPPPTPKIPTPAQGVPKAPPAAPASPPTPPAQQQP